MANSQSTSGGEGGASGQSDSLQQLRQQREQATDPAEQQRLDARISDAEQQAQSGSSGSQQ